MAFELPPLPYPYNSLEPHIDERTMRIHHEKHHGGYVSKLNAALEGKSEFQGKSIEDILSNLGQVPDNIRTAVRNNGGGHFNHTIFWQIMGPNKGGAPKGNIANAINSAFGNFDKFKEEFNNAATTLFGSGWAWVALDSGNNLKIVQTPNQDNPISQGMKPVFGLDVWEHAYYLKYQNVRADYIKAWWNVVNWDAIEERFNSLR